jgi:hypothetical protein
VARWYCPEGQTQGGACSDRSRACDAASTADRASRTSSALLDRATQTDAWASVRECHRGGTSHDGESALYETGVLGLRLLTWALAMVAGVMGAWADRPRRVPEGSFSSPGS